MYAIKRIGAYLAFSAFVAFYATAMMPQTDPSADKSQTSEHRDGQPDGSPALAPTPELFEPGIISGPADDGSPTFSPDGNTSLFHSQLGRLVSHSRVPPLE